ncbi:hypothetical protein [Nocardioides rubriscoriae]|uniref:hypothetical protein n=1 Tax=Nocardioides rubriscoriae TaxID=642762 RepID=UPI0011E016B8|nr:hypothetical protein [Nocardioides rubriscoriae]
MTELAVSYEQVGRAARAWDEQHVDLVAASTQVADAPPLGFSPRVAVVALLFRLRWAEHLSDLGEESEVRADGLRDALRDYLDSDETSVVASWLLQGLLEEHR